MLRGLYGSFFDVGMALFSGRIKWCLTAKYFGQFAPIKD